MKIYNIKQSKSIFFIKKEAYGQQNQYELIYGFTGANVGLHPRFIIIQATRNVKKIKISLLIYTNVIGWLISVIPQHDFSSQAAGHNDTNYLKLWETKRVIFCRNALTQE